MNTKLNETIAEFTAQQCKTRIAQIDAFLNKTTLLGKPRNEWQSKAHKLISYICKELKLERRLLYRRMKYAKVVRMRPADGWRVLVLSPKYGRRGFLWQRSHAAETIPLLAAFVHFFAEVKLMRIWYPNKIDHTFRVRMVAPCGIVVAEERLKRREIVLKSDLYPNG
jgi:hypothetical protein